MKYNMEITIKIAKNGYIVEIPTITINEKGEKEMCYETHVFQRDIHAMKFIRDRLPLLEVEV